MSFTNGLTGTQPFNSRALLDINFIANANFPNAANVVNSAGLDLRQAVPYPVTDRVDFQIVVNTAGVGANNKNVNFWVQDSADNGNWTNVAAFAIPLLQVVDNGNTNTNTGSVTFKLEPTSRRYVRVQAQGESGGGAGTNGTWTFQALF